MDNKFSDEHVVTIVTSGRISWLGHVQRIDDHRMHKKILNLEIYGRMKTRTVKKTMDNRRVEGPQVDENSRLASEDTRSTGMEESYAGGQGPNWTVALD